MGLVPAGKQMVAKWLIRPWVALGLYWRHLRLRWSIAKAHQHGAAYALVKESAEELISPPKVVAVITHVSRPDAADPQKKGDASLKRLRSTVEGVLGSFAHCQVHLIINTYRDWHHADQLPDELKGRMEVVRTEDGDPMFLGFRALELMKPQQGKAAWFIHLEDDIVIQDATLLDKLAFFNACTGDTRSLLLPNRFELSHGRKYYIDLRWPHDDFRAETWAAPGTLRFGDTFFGQCSNGHSGCYILSAAQFDRWVASPREWHNQLTGAGPQESWSSTMLKEVFEIYKPHPKNLHFLEVFHCDPTYFPRLLHYEREKQIIVPCHRTNDPLTS